VVAICNLDVKSDEQKHRICKLLCFVDCASLYNLVNKANLVHNLAMPHKQNKHINIRTIKFGNAKQAKQTHQYTNIKIKLYKTNAEIWYNKTCRLKQLKPNNISIKLCTKLALFTRQNLYLSRKCCTGIVAAV